MLRRLGIEKGKRRVWTKERIVEILNQRLRQDKTIYCSELIREYGGQAQFAVYRFGMYLPHKVFRRKIYQFLLGLPRPKSDEEELELLTSPEFKSALLAKKREVGKKFHPDSNGGDPVKTAWFKIYFQAFGQLEKRQKKLGAPISYTPRRWVVPTERTKMLRKRYIQRVKNGLPTE